MTIEVDKKMIDWKYIFWSVIGISFLIDIFQEGLMTIGIILGWLIGLMTMIQWRIEEKKSQPKLKVKGKKND